MDKFTGLNRKILVVDDTDSLREALCTLLRTVGYSKITHAIDGLDALRKSLACHDEEPFEMIFSDIKMPNCDGIEFVGDVRKLEAYAKTPIIMVSTESELETIVSAIEAGADDYVLKPYNAKTVIEKIESVDKKKKL